MKAINAANPGQSRKAGRAAAKVIIERYRGTGSRTYVKENGRHQHRVVAERKLGRPLKTGEVVHHIDGNKKNNDPDNLMVTTQRQHMREHGIGVPGKPLPWKPWTKRKDRHANV